MIPAILTAVGVDNITVWGPPHMGSREVEFHFLTQTESLGLKKHVYSLRHKGIFLMYIKKCTYFFMYIHTHT